MSEERIDTTFLSEANMDKAAVLLLTLESINPGINSKIMSVIGEDKAKLLLERISQIGKVDPDKRREVINDFYGIALEKQFLFGGLDISSKILKESFGINKAKEYFKSKKEKFKFFEDVSVIELRDFLLKETDQMKIFVFNYLSPKKASELLMQLDDDNFVMKIMSNVEIPNPELLYDFEMELSAYFNATNDDAAQGSGEYLEKLAATIEFLPDEKREEILGKYEAVNEAFAAKVRALIFTFEDFNKLNDQVFQTILFEIADFRLIALGMLQTSPQLLSKINRCLTDRTKAIVDSESMGLEKKSSLEQINDAKRKIVAVARKLEKKGGIKLNGQ